MRLLSAVFRKEMVTLARRKRHYFARALILGSLLTVIGVAWQEAGVVGALQYGGFTDLATIGRSLYRFFMMTQVAAALLLMPALAATVVAAEKERRTLGLLLMSNLSPGNILLDKLLSRLSLFGLLLLAGIPLFVVCLAFGGVSLDEVITAYLGVLGLMLFCCGVGLYASTFCQRSYVALIVTYAIVGVFFLVAYDRRDFSDTAVQLMSFGVGTLVFALAVMTCKRMLPVVAQRERRSWVRRLFARLSAFFHRINFTGVVVFDESRALKGSAMLWKETHNRLFSSTTFLIRSFYAMILISMVAFALLIGLNIRVVSIALVIVSGGLIVLCTVAIVASSTAFAGEREKHSLDVLLSMPVTALSIVTAKFIGVMRLMVPLMIIVVLWFMAGKTLDYSYYWHRDFDTWLLVRTPFVYVGYLPLLVVIGLSASASRRGSGAALLQTVLICLAWCVLPLIVSPFFSYLPRLLFGVDCYGWGEWISCLSPIVDLDPDCYDEWPWAGILAIPAWMTLLWILVRRFDRIMGRV